MKPGLGIPGHGQGKPAKRPRGARKAALGREFNRIVKENTPERSEAYKAFVRSQPCIVSGARSGIEAHHWSPRGSKGMGSKVSDFSCVPLHHAEHRYWHDKGHLRGMTRAESEALMVETQERLRAMFERLGR